MEKNQIPVFTARRSLTAPRRSTVDGIATHCGFIENHAAFWHGQHKIQRACDRFFAARGMVWVPKLADYMPAATAAAIASLLT